MDSRLQQAIIATRAGYNEAAQVLLTDALKENPHDTSAWFLLAHLVESNARQARYLEYTLFLDPDHELARQHLERLLNPEVPPPVIKVTNKNGPTSPMPPPSPAVNSETSAIPPARTNSSLIVSSKPEPALEAPAIETTQVTDEQKSSRIDSDWQKSAPQPKRASQPASAVQQKPIPKQSAVSQTTTKTTMPETKSEPVNKWLLIIFFVLVAVAAFIVGYLVYTILFQ
jgi:FtsZ-interacting cell division protein ZipA